MRYSLAKNKGQIALQVRGAHLLSGEPVALGGQELLEAGEGKRRKFKIKMKDYSRKRWKINANKLTIPS